ncbi:S-layer homology domain-containing protein [Paenibacillus sanguinis]|uniref:S-layer homology domain-containing protein n=1 Tax=Paenibacillus sanguinis TaxID=225906 RepID=UPI00037C0718|nr:S-layer homology domain-containing protein [Paenibacillus sanguinis]
MKKYIAGLLVLLFALSPISVFAADAFTLTLNANEVRWGGTLTLSGTVPEQSGGNVNVKIVSPAQTVLYVDVLSAVDGMYSATVGIPDNQDLAPLGRYTVIAGYGEANQTASFSIVSGSKPGDGGGSSPGSGSGGDSGSAPTPSVPSPPQAPRPDDTGIPPQAGEASGSTTRPELAADGRYLVGRDTLAKAAEQAQGGAVTILLPAAAGEAGTALELPATSVSELNKRNIGLVITTDNRTVSLPAGALAVSGDASSRIRIVVNASWSTEAQATVNQSLESVTDYKATGVVLSVIVQVISGDRVQEIHQLDRPAKVSIQLTPEQEQQIFARLAGVYYVDGQSAKYVPGQLQNGTYTFMAEHFSYYTILEYDKSFVDLREHWAEQAVKGLAAKHIVTGVDDRHYAPNRGITRAEFVTLIVRAVTVQQAADGQTVEMNAAQANAFRDVSSDRYYAQPVAQAVKLGIVTGYNGAFRPNESITREEAVVALVRAAEVMEAAARAEGGKAPSFADASQISAWATEAVGCAFTQGWIQGDGSRFNPKNAVTRAEVAVMVERLL